MRRAPGRQALLEIKVRGALETIMVSEELLDGVGSFGPVATTSSRPLWLISSIGL
jgi:hypothetical protein